MLVAACFLWGVSFVIVKDALSAATPLAFVALRFGLAAAVLAPFAQLGAPFAKGELAAGGLLGLLLGAGFIAQTAGLVHTTPSRSAFIVAISSVLAPAIAALLLRERPRLSLVVAVLLAGAGTYFLSAPESGGLNRGDLLTMITAVLFGGQIVAIAALSRRYDAMRLVWLQIAGTAVLSVLGMAVLEHPRIAWSPAFVGAVAFTGVGATVVALLWQVQAQRHMSTTRAALLFCFETLFAALASWVWLGERLSLLQWLGGGLILGGMVLADLPPTRPAPRPGGGSPVGFD
jgi:drug/metabolite transporter (DMT)-like permease